MTLNTVHTEPSSSLRKVCGSLRLAASVFLLVALITQIIDKSVHHTLIPSQYFMYFTIQSTMMNIVVLAVGGAFAMRYLTDIELYTTVRMSILVYAIITAGVYNLLLRSIPLAVGEPPSLQWPLEVMHVWIPIFILLDWILTPGRARLAWSRLWFIVIYPLVWLVVTLARGVITNWFPYPFLEPSNPGGWFSVAVYVLGIAVFVIGLGSAAIALSRRPAKLTS